jgi:type II secretion system protein H
MNMLCRFRYSLSLPIYIIRSPTTRGERMLSVIHGPRNNLRCKGFSLVELLVTMVVVGIVSSLAFPSFAGLTNDYRVKKAARQLMTDLQYARMKAVAEGVQYKVAFTTGTTSYTINKGNSSSGSTTWTQDGTARQLADASNPYYTRGVSLSQSTAVDVIFSTTGNAAPSSGTAFPTITFTASSGTSRSKQVTVLLTGRVRIS